MIVSLAIKENEIRNAFQTFKLNNLVNNKFSKLLFCSKDVSLVHVYKNTACI